MSDASGKLTWRARGGGVEADWPAMCHLPGNHSAVIARTVERLSEPDMPFVLAGRIALLATAVLLQGGPQIPPPRGLVNDFANVLSPESEAQMERIAQDVREVDAETLTFGPDVAGDYTIELRAFDGELWSQPAVSSR